MITQVAKKEMLAVQKSTGPRCPDCGGILQVHNYSTGTIKIIDGRGTRDDIHEDYRLFCGNCKRYITDPIVEKDPFEDVFDEPPF